MIRADDSHALRPFRDPDRGRPKGRDVLSDRRSGEAAERKRPRALEQLAARDAVVLQRAQL